MPMTKKQKRGTQRRVTKSRAMKPSMKKAVTEIATKVVSRKSETKWAATDAISPIVLYGDIAPIGANPQVFPAICPIQQGDGDNNRIGNQVTPVKVSADVFLSLARTAVQGGTTQDGSWDITAHIWYGYVKRYKNASDVISNASVIANQLLDLGGSGVTQYKRFTGLIQDTMFPLNTEYLNMKHKSVRLFKSYGTANTNSPLAGGVTQYFPDRVSSVLKLSFKPPKTLKYSTADEPENFCPVVVIGYQHNDATQAANGNVGTPILATEMVTKIWYKDE